MKIFSQKAQVENFVLKEYGKIIFNQEILGKTIQMQNVGLKFGYKEISNKENWGQKALV